MTGDGKIDLRSMKETLEPSRVRAASLAQTLATQEDVLMPTGQVRIEYPAARITTC